MGVDFQQLRSTAKAVRTLLRRANLPTDFGEAIRQLARTIRDHKHFETILTSCTAEERQELYDAVVPNLSFTAKPLDKYVASAGQMAEREQLPVVLPDGRLGPFKPARDVSSVAKDAENAIAQALAERILIVVCSKCTREDKFYGVGRETNVDVVLKARRAGWIYDYTVRPAVEICPACPTSLRENA